MHNAVSLSAVFIQIAPKNEGTDLHCLAPDSCCGDEAQPKRTTGSDHQLGFRVLGPLGFCDLRFRVLRCFSGVRGSGFQDTFRVLWFRALIRWSKV